MHQRTIETHALALVNALTAMATDAADGIGICQAARRLSEHPACPKTAVLSAIEAAAEQLGVPWMK